MESPLKSSSGLSDRIEVALDSALRYLDRGWSVVPLCTPIPGGPGCQQHGPGCKHPGKQPLASWTPYQERLPTEAEIREWWRRWPDANVGLVLGNISRLMVLDSDVRRGGNDTLDALLTEGKRLPDCPKVLTGGGGSHFYFATRGPVPSIPNLFAGVELKADGATITAPHSLHASGKRYEWVIDPEVAGTWEAPTWLREAIDNHHQAHQGLVLPDTIPEGERNTTLFRLAAAMRARGMSESGILAALEVENSRCDPPLPNGELALIARSAGNYPPSSQGQAAGGNEQQPSPWPSPPAPEAFHGLAGDIVRAIEPHSEADPVALLANILVAFGSVVGQGPHFVAEKDKHYTNLFVQQVAETSKGRKGTAWGQVADLFSQASPEWRDACVKGGLSSGEGLIWAVRDKIEKLEPIKEKGRVVETQTVVVDEGVCDKRLLVLETEFASTLKMLRREGNTLSPVVRQAWDTGNLNTLTKHSPARATDAHISVIGHVTAADLVRYLDDTEVGNGFANRFLWLCVRRSKELPDGGGLAEIDSRPLIQRLQEAISFARTVGEMRRDDGARKIWHSVYGELSGGKPGLVGAVTARAEAQVLRLACIYALLDQSGEVKAEHLLAALALWDYSEASTRYIFRDALGDSVADTILGALKGVGANGLTRTQISDLFGRNVSAKRIGQALQTLVALSRACPKGEHSGGRPVERWFAT